MTNWKTLSQSLDHIPIKRVWTYDTFKNRSHHPDGQSSVIYTNGSSYVGDFVKDVPCGVGTFRFADRSTYEGEVVDGFFHGEGRYVRGNGDAYAGEFANGKPHGLGRATLEGGQIVYEGEFVEGLPHGRGVLRDASPHCPQPPRQPPQQQITEAPDEEEAEGKKEDEEGGDAEVPYIYEGLWIKGKRHDGKGREQFPDGSVYTGHFADGTRSGRGVLSSADGTPLYTGQWVYGKKHGRGVERIEDGSGAELAGYFIRDRRLDATAGVAAVEGGEGAAGLLQ